MKNMSLITIAVDAMGGDFGPKETIPSIIHALKANPNLSIIAVGQESEILPALKDSPFLKDERLRIHHAEEIVEMDESPQSALKNKKDSSMRVAINLVKEGVADACVSAGNTGALMATARFVLKMLPGIDRPAICTALPSLVTPKKHVYMLDLGANVDVNSDHLQQFAIMGSAVCSAIDENPSPRVGLLNIGSEAIKGNDLVKQAAIKLQETPLNYIGFVEGDGIFFDNVDVIVCDGFSGNIALKTLEGTSKFISTLIKTSFKKNLYSMIVGLLSKPVFKYLRSQADPKNYNGASLVGLKGIVVKSHGNADQYSFANAISIAHKLASQKLIEKIENQFDKVS